MTDKDKKRYNGLTAFEITSLVGAHAESFDDSMELIQSCGEAENEVTMKEASDEVNETLDTIAELINALCKKVQADEE